MKNYIWFMIASLLLLQGVVISAAASSVYYPSSITDVTSTHSSQPISVLSVNDQSGASNSWNDYVEFSSTKKAYSGIFNFNIGSAQSVTAMSLKVNYMGQAWTFQKWTFEVYLNPSSSAAASWAKIGDSSADTAGWNSWTMLSFTANVDFTRVVSSTNIIQIRMTSATAYDDCDIDFVQLTLTSTASSASSTSSSTASTSSSSTTTTTKATTSSTSASTSASTSSSTTTSSTSSSTSGTSTTSSGSGSTTGTSGSSKGIGLKMLILAKSATAVGVDFVVLAFNSTGIAYDFLAVTSSTSLTTVLSTSSTTGTYAGIVSVTKALLSASQQASVIAYQNAFGVKWVVVGSNPSGLPGLQAGTSTTSVGTLTLAPAFAKFGSYLQTSASIDTKTTINWSGYGAATIIPATITDTNVATPAIMVTVGGNTQVAVAQIKNTDGTLQLHYFVDEVADYLHTRIFAPMMVNWISPGGIFQGARRLIFSVQADDLFLASNLWSTTSHSNPLSDSLIYRMTDSDLAAIAAYYDSLNPSLPQGSHMTVEWPFNGAGTTWYISPDTLFSKAQELQNKFYFLSHTWDHPCDLDTASYAEMNTELVNNINFTPSLLTGGLNSPVFSRNSMVTPCITGLFNGNVLQAMVANGITNCVGDNSVLNLVPSNLYHYIPTTVATNGYAGVFIVPRQDLDIDYDVTIPAELVDEYNTVYNVQYTFEQIMQIQLLYGLELQLAFRHDPFMMHQANGRSFSYNDPVAGKTHNVSFITLFTDRIVQKVMSFYNMPIVTQPLSVLSNTWKTRYDMDFCGFSATLQTSGGFITAIKASSTSSCLVGLSGVTLTGATVTVERVGAETTSWVQMTANTPQTLSLSSPISL